MNFKKKEIEAYREDVKKESEVKSFFGRSNTLNYILQQFTQSTKNSKETLSIHNSPEVTRKEKKIREMVNKNEFLAN